MPTSMIPAAAMAADQTLADRRFVDSKEVTPGGGGGGHFVLTLSEPNAARRGFPIAWRYGAAGDAVGVSVGTAVAVSVGLAEGVGVGVGVGVRGVSGGML